jgi:hypothetical protein
LIAPHIFVDIRYTKLQQPRRAYSRVDKVDKFPKERKLGQGKAKMMVQPVHYSESNGGGMGMIGIR